MKKLFLTITLLVAGLAQAQTPSTTAGALALNCARVVPGARADNGPSASCVLVLSAYLNGWRAGADRGARTGLLNDKEALSTTRGIDDVQRRVALLRLAARCMPDQITFFDVARDLVTYVQQHPERAGQPYSTVLSDLLQDAYCP